MQTNQEAILEVLGKPDTHLLVPVYQRVYAWTAPQCDALWRDICHAGRTNAPHFMGTILVGDEGRFDSRQTVGIVDGQQRLASVTLILAALRDHLRQQAEDAAGVSPDEIHELYLTVGNACKMQLSPIDCATMEALVLSQDLPEGDDLSRNVLSNYENFRTRMQTADATVVWRGLEALRVVFAQLEADDRAQLVFESLNSKGTPLSTLDLTRNLLMIGLDADEQARLFENHWLPLEELFDDDPDSSRFAAALRGWLAVKAPKLCRGGEGSPYEMLKALMESEDAPSAEEALAGLKGFCQSFILRSQSSGARMADAHNTYGVARVEGIISEKKLFGD